MSKRLNVLFLCSWYPSRVFRANGDFIQRHAEAVSLLHNVTAFHIVTDPNLDDKDIEYVFTVIKSVNTKIAYVKPSKNPLVKTIRFYRAFKYMFKSSEKIDLVHLNVLYPFGIFALYLKIFRAIPYMISDHWSAYHNGGNTFSFLERLLMKSIARYSSFISPVSNDLGKSMRGMGLKGKYHKVPNVVDTSIFNVRPDIMPNEELVILHVSSMIDDVKNVTGMLRAISKIDEGKQPYRCYFIGGESPIPNNNPRVTFIPHMEQPELVDYFHKADVFLLFSNTENLPCVILESFSCGAPVISTNVGGVSENFPDEFGTLISVQDEIQLTKTLQNWKKSNVDKRKMHHYVETHFSKEVISQDFSRLYKKMIS